MKIRIKGNTLRLRLTKSEVIQLAGSGSVEERTSFPLGNEFIYSLKTENLATPTASFNQNHITVTVSDSWAKNWSNSEEVGLSFSIPTQYDTLDVLIEKDFNCLTPRADEEQHDHFANPLTSHQKC